jgi:hypothetical protein
MLDRPAALRGSSGLYAVKDSVRRGEHLCALYDHLDHMLVAQVGCGSVGIFIDYEDVHGEILPQIADLSIQ